MKVLIVRLSAMGDIVHTLPLAANLARAGHEVAWLIETPFAALLLGNPALRRLHLAQPKLWRRSPLSARTRREIAALARELREERYECVLDTMGSWKSLWLARMARAKRIVLDDRARRRDLSRLLGGSRVVPPEAARHFVEVTLALLTPLGVPVAGPRPDARYLLACATSRSAEVLAQLPRHFALYHPGAGWANKRWDPRRLAEAARAISGEMDLPPVVSCGRGDESAVAGLLRELAAPQLPPLDFPDFAAVVARAGLFVGGDTGPLHLADALGVPTVALFGPTDPGRNGPYGDPRGVVSLALPCSPCWQRYNAEKLCLAGISPAQVAGRAAAVIRNPLWGSSKIDA